MSPTQMNEEQVKELDHRIWEMNHNANVGAMICNMVAGYLKLTADNIREYIKVESENLRWQFSNSPSDKKEEPPNAK